MITLTQYTKSEQIAELTSYYILDVRTTGPDPVTNAIDSVAMLQIEEDEILWEVVARIVPDDAEEASPETGYFRSGEIADRLARILNRQTVISEPPDLQFLRVLLEKYGYDGEIFFIPISKLANAVYPELKAGNIAELAARLELSEPEDAGLLRTAYLENEIFALCRRDIFSTVSPGLKGVKKPRKKGKKKRKISNSTLVRWAESIWSVSPWVLVAAAFLIVFFVILNIPRKRDTTLDRNVAPVSYLVLSWDQPGKYGAQTKPAKGEDYVPIEFRIPYGVYNVLNNNSIPVVLQVASDEVKEKSEQAQKQPDDSDAEAAELSVSASAVADDEEDAGPVSVTMRPNSSRQITVDTDQYVTLSEDAKDLIFFYVSEVPEEKESDTMGQDNGGGGVVYAYIKGTEVRFRQSPSLEGQILDTMQNGQQVQVLGVTGEWTHVSVQNKKGYIFSQFLTSEDPQAAAYAEKIAEAKAAEEASQQAVETPASETAQDSLANDQEESVLSGLTPAEEQEA